MKTIEIDFIVSDSLAALELYEKVFEVERVEVTDFERGLNEAIFTIYGTTFHLLDENPEYQLFAPKEDHPMTMWINVTVPDIQTTYEKALEAGCTEVQPITKIEDFGVSNASFMDPFGYHWMLHQVHREVSFEERNELWENRGDN